eukprot:2496341-Lingulodinium_polyedra.AAC.1
MAASPRGAFQSWSEMRLRGGQPPRCPRWPNALQSRGSVARAMAAERYVPKRLRETVGNCRGRTP